MTETTQGVHAWLARWTSNPYAYLTTIGRQTGRPHRIEIWFGEHDGRMYVLAGGGERSDWVRNLQANPQVTVELGDETHPGAARAIEPGIGEDQRARELLAAKYATPAKPLDDWKRRSLPVAVEFPTGAEAAHPRSNEHDTD